MKTPAEVQYFWRVYGKRFLHHGLVTECDVPQHFKRRALFEPTFHTKSDNFEYLFLINIGNYERQHAGI